MRRKQRKFRKENMFFFILLKKIETFGLSVQSAEQISTFREWEAALILSAYIFEQYTKNRLLLTDYKLKW